MTLNEVWAGSRDTTMRAFRASRGEAIYISLAHDTVDVAVKSASAKQPGIGLDDILADDWEVRN